MTSQTMRDFLRGSFQPGVPGFALLAGLEAVVRGTTLSSFPLLMYHAYGNASLVSEFYFCVGLISLATLMMAPQLTRLLPRSRVYMLGVSLYLVAALCGIIGGRLTGVALLTNAMAAATAFVCFNAYILDTIDKSEFSKMESSRLLYGAIGWTAGPLLGVWLLQFWQGAPFLITSSFAGLMLLVFHKINPGNGGVIQRTARASTNPWVFLRRFFAQPRLIAGFLFALIRSCGWQILVIYLGIFAVENHLPEAVGGAAMSVANAGLFVAPLMLRWVRKRRVKDAVRMGFAITGTAFLTGAALSPWPWLAIAVMLTGAIGLILLDICGGLPFLMSVKPSERTEMSAVYSSFRDVSGILTPGVAWLVLQVAPLPGVFAVAGLAMMAALLIANQLHPRLGQKRGAPGQSPAV
ncbi:MAG: MFS transporter [Rhodobacteraceae bacterium]|nr:MFS transporter [Paracoccaceae bacterium]